MRARAHTHTHFVPPQVGDATLEGPEGQAKHGTDACVHTQSHTHTHTHIQSLADLLQVGDATLAQKGKHIVKQLYTEHPEVAAMSDAKVRVCVYVCVCDCVCVCVLAPSTLRWPPW